MSSPNDLTEFTRRVGLSRTPRWSEIGFFNSNPIYQPSQSHSTSTETAMLYRIAASDAPILIDQLGKCAQGKMSNREHRAKFNRLSQGIQRLLGLKGKVASLSMILTQSTLEIGVEMTGETFSKASDSSMTIGVGDCTCGTIDGHPHDPECKWWLSHENRVRSVFAWLHANGFNVYGPNIDLKRREMYPSCRDFTADEVLEAAPLIRQDLLTRVNPD